MVVRWKDFADAAPEIAHAGERLLVPEQGAVAYFATLASETAPRLSPVCPIFVAGGLYLLIGGKTPKCRDLRARPGYVLHAAIGAEDEEFVLSGTVREIDVAGVREVVLAAVPFPNYDPEDPIFALNVARVLWTHWKNPGSPDTRPIREVWRSPA